MYVGMYPKHGILLTEVEGLSVRKKDRESTRRERRVKLITYTGLLGVGVGPVGVIKQKVQLHGWNLPDIGNADLTMILKMMLILWLCM